MKLDLTHGYAYITYTDDGEVTLEYIHDLWRCIDDIPAAIRDRALSGRINDMFDDIQRGDHCYGDCFSSVRVTR